MTEEIRNILIACASAYHCADFICDDPVQFHRFSLKQDIEISGLLTAIMSFGNRKQIVKKAGELHRLMGESPYRYVLSVDGRAISPPAPRTVSTACFLMLTFVVIFSACMMLIPVLAVWRMRCKYIRAYLWRNYVHFLKSRHAVPKRS